MASIDPWEQRERERERWRTKSNRSAGSKNALIPKFSSRVLWICALLVFHLVGDMPTVSQTLRTAVLCLGFVGWMTFLGLHWPSSSRARTGQMPVIAFMIALITWVSYKSLGTGFPMQAFGGWLRWMSASAALISGLWCMGSRSERTMVLACVGGIAVFVAGVDLSRYGTSGDVLRGSTFHASSLSLFGTHEAIGTLLGFLLPIASAFAVHKGTEGLQKSITVGMTLIIALAWAFARCRAGWLGGIAGCFTIGILSFVASRRHGVVNNEPLVQRIIGSVWLWLLTGGGIVLASSGLAGALSSRVGGALAWWELGSVAARQSLWQAAYRMILNKPLIGWGTSGFMTSEGLLSHHGEAPWQVKLTGGTLANNAHSFPLQYAVDYGIPAFILLLFFITWLWGPALCRAVLLHPQTSLMSRAACGLMVAVCISALGSPAYELTSVLIWVSVVAGTLIGADDSTVSAREHAVSTAINFAVLVAPALVLFPLLRPKVVPHTLALSISKVPEVTGDVAAVKALSTSNGNIDSSFPGTEFVSPEIAVINAKGHIVRVVPVPETATRWTYNRRTNTEADAILEVTIPPVEVKAGESLELGIRGTISYVDGEHRTAGVSVPLPTH